MNVAELQRPQPQPAVTEFILYYMTGQGVIESAIVSAHAWDTIGPYLVFWRDDRLVTAIPHTSVLQFGDLEEANRSFVPENPDDEGSYVSFAEEPKDPWAELTGKD